jgi:hypothetical protein
MVDGVFVAGPDGAVSFHPLPRRTRPYRQWTLSVPWQRRALLAHDRRLLSAALTCVVRAVFCPVRRGVQERL